MRVSPCRDQVLVRKSACSDSDAYGESRLIVVPEDYQKEIKFFGEVLAVGPEVKELSAGDLVILDAHSEVLWNTNAPEDGELAFVLEDDVLTVVSEKPEYLHVVPQEMRRFDSVSA